MKRIGWWAMAVTAVLVALYALAAILAPSTRQPFLAELFDVKTLLTFAHLGGGLIALAVGPFQLSSRLRARAIGTHRWMGRAYVYGILVGGIAGLLLGFGSQGGLVANFGFSMLAVCWLLSTGIAFYYIRTGRQADHRRWMYRSFALTFAAVTLRVWLPLSQVAGVPFEEFYPVVAWLCWVPNLVVVEWFVLARESRVRPVTATAPTLPPDRP